MTLAIRWAIAYIAVNRKLCRVAPLILGAALETDPALGEMQCLRS